MSSNTIQVPQRCTLDGFAREVAATEGINIREVEPLTTLLVQTMNSLYRIIPLEAGRSRIMVQGGQFFPDLVEAHLAGSTFGGSFLKMHWIGVGLHMEINSNGERIVTSPVRSFRIEQDAPVHSTH
jgi:hypothetical protein